MSTMTRRDFVRTLALLAAGTAALPEQVLAFERYYNANTPPIGGPFIAVDELCLGGIACKSSTPIRGNLFCEGTSVLPIGLNAFGGVFFWRAPADGKLISEPADFTLVIETIRDSKWVQPSDSWLQGHLQGYIKYIDQDAVRHTVVIETAARTLG